MKILTVWVQYHRLDTQTAKYDFRRFEDPHWSIENYHREAKVPQIQIHGYVDCDKMLEGEVAHSCPPGTGPHRVKVSVLEGFNDPDAFNELLDIAGPKPDKL